MPARTSIPVIDLFAGPGGLGEGFSRFQLPDGQSAFKIALSIEKDEKAHETLLLRSFFRHADRPARNGYYRHMRGEITRRQLFEEHPRHADAASKEAWLAELGETSADLVQKRIAESLGNANPWVLIGGPPCQAYSLAGRSRNKGNAAYRPADDVRQTLYLEYLQIIAEHWPAVFVMENVKGLLSATLERQRMFDRIHEDLESPVDALDRSNRKLTSAKKSHRYRIYSVVQSGIRDESGVGDFVVRAEEYQIPQARHRLILLGVRDDLNGATPTSLVASPRISAESVLHNLPPLRSGLSKDDDAGNWLRTIKQAAHKSWLGQVRKCVNGAEIVDELCKTVAKLRVPPFNRGADFIRCELKPLEQLDDWFRDDRIEGVCNHSARGHMSSDLFRYLFAACFAEVVGRSPALVDFPNALRPDHRNVKEALDGSLFADRFRVQLRSRPSTTITSHIAKDGHYYIHYDPRQCRSLTVREAARLQTFPDNYLFCGPRTCQYAQVGNAVPPLLAYQIAEVVWGAVNNRRTRV